MPTEPSKAAVVRLMLRELEHAIGQAEEEISDCDYNLARIKNQNVISEADRRHERAWENVRDEAIEKSDKSRLRANALLACLKAAGWALDDLDVTAAG